MSETETMTLTDFLLARTAEDETAAREIQRRIEADPGSSAEIGLAHPELAAGDSPDHLGEYDPARVLAECEAKRQIVGLHTGAVASGYWNSCAECGHYSGTYDTESVDWPCPTLHALALPYVDHPEFREEWRS